MKKLAVVLLVAVLALALAWGGYALWAQVEERRIVAAADELQVPGDWTRTSTLTVPPRLFCVDGACPRVQRDYRAPDGLSTAAFADLFTASGWQLTLESACEPRRNGAEMLASCSAFGSVRGYQVVVYYRSSSAKPGSAVLSVHIQQ